MGAWIETSSAITMISGCFVAPRVGAWIETRPGLTMPCPTLQSHPVWVRGLKQRLPFVKERLIRVAPRVGAWIETVSKATIDEAPQVAPRVGAWIETRRRARGSSTIPSHPVWVRGLKHLLINSIYVTKIWLVAPRVGAWIETIKSR